MLPGLTNAITAESDFIICTTNSCTATISFSDYIGEQECQYCKAKMRVPASKPLCSACKDLEKLGILILHQGSYILAKDKKVRPSYIIDPNDAMGSAGWTLTNSTVWTTCNGVEVELTYAKNNKVTKKKFIDGILTEETLETNTYVANMSGGTTYTGTVTSTTSGSP